MTTLYERIGGAPAIKSAVDLFYDRVLADDQIAHFFKGVDMPGQTSRQRAFLVMAFGGPNTYGAADMRRSHAHLVARGLNDHHFGLVAEHLVGTLVELGVEPGDIEEVVAIVESVRDDVLGRDKAAA
jgi:hemoglobin